MSESANVTVVNKTSWLGLLGIIFVLCKIFEYGPIAAWSWWWVLCPFWIGLAIFLGLIALSGVAVLITLAVAWFADRR